MSEAIDANTLWADIFVDELVRSGLRHVSLAPGSRSTPLVLAFARQSQVRLHTLIDERSAAFLALGIAQVTRRPAAVLCTSGTAVANLHPAVVEAMHAGIPLILLTADRPPELRRSGANQAIDQTRFFGESVKWYLDFPLPEPSPGTLSLRYIHSVSCQAYAQAVAEPMGPVHINLPFRKPLEPPVSGESSTSSTLSSDLEGVEGRSGHEPWSEIIRGPRILPEERIEGLSDLLRTHRRGVIVLGPRSRTETFSRQLVDLANSCGYPVLADPLSGARFSSMAASRAVLCGAYDWYLEALDPEPEVIVRLGGLPVSSALEGWMESRIEAVHVSMLEGRNWPDPGHQVRWLLDADPGWICARLANALDRSGGSPEADEAWLESFRQAEATAWPIIEETVAESYCEGGLVADLLQHLPAESLIFSASSLPVRHLDQFGRPTPKPLRLFANRGVSGIDGTLSSAAGVQVGSQSPVTLIAGDLAFHHDETGLLAIQKYAGGGTIVLINNGGGGIFRRLPIARFEPPFTELFRAPIRVDNQALIKAYGGLYQAVADRPGFRKAFEAPFPDSTFRVIEFHSDLDRHERNRDRIKTKIKEVIHHGGLD